MKKIKYIIIGIVLISCSSPNLNKFIDSTDIENISKINKQQSQGVLAIYSNKEFAKLFNSYDRVSEKLIEILWQDTLDSEPIYKKDITVDEELAGKWGNYINIIDTIFNKRLHNIEYLDEFIKTQKLETKTYKYANLHDKSFDLEQSFSKVLSFYMDSILEFGQKEYFIKTSIIPTKKWEETSDSVLVNLNAYIVSHNMYKNKIIILGTDTFYTKDDIFNIDIPVKNELGVHTIKGKFLGITKFTNETREYKFSTDYTVTK